MYFALYPLLLVRMEYRNDVDVAGVTPKLSWKLEADEVQPGRIKNEIAQKREGRDYYLACLPARSCRESKSSAPSSTPCYNLDSMRQLDARV